MSAFGHAMKALFLFAFLWAVGALLTVLGVL